MEELEWNGWYVNVFDTDCCVAILPYHHHGDTSLILVMSPSSFLPWPTRWVDAPTREEPRNFTASSVVRMNALCNNRAERCSHIVIILGRCLWSGIAVSGSRSIVRAASHRQASVSTSDSDGPTALSFKLAPLLHYVLSLRSDIFRWLADRLNVPSNSKQKLSQFVITIPIVRNLFSADNPFASW